MQENIPIVNCEKLLEREQKNGKIEKLNFPGYVWFYNESLFSSVM